MKEYRIHSAGEEISVRVIYSGRRSLGLQVKDDGTVCARVPDGVPDSMVSRFIEEHMDWILQRRRKSMAPDGVPVTRLPEVTTTAEKRQIRQLVTQRVAYYAEIMGIAYGRVSMRNQRTRWGSCSSDGNLNFNCRLLYVPTELVDYVVVHELAHRKHMNHSAAFWREVERILPDYRERRDRLKQYGIG